MSNSIRPFRLFATDIEDTLLGDVAAARHFREVWESLDPNQRPLLAYNSGRSVQEIQWFVLERRIPRAEFIIGGVGTEVHDPIDANSGAEFHASIASAWDPATLEKIVHELPGVRLQPEEYLNPCKRSWYWPRASGGELVRLEARLRDAGLRVTVLYSDSVFLDVIPSGAGKGNALAWVCRRIGVPLENVLVAGAGANNGSMFALPGVRGVVVGNASSELFAASRPFNPMIAREENAGGVLAALSHFGVLQEVAQDSH
jgi:sucrose-6F-phosphate phosphohydrolase